MSQLNHDTDFKRYTLNDMAKIGCSDCAGCFQCCCDMGESVILDPYDAYRLTVSLGKNFEQLMEDAIELHVEDSLILPNLKMRDNTEKSCFFLNDAGRCSIHNARPGLCRLFPLGRNYEGEKLEYFVLQDACPAKQKTKVKISRWLDTENLKTYQQFLTDWHNYVKALKERLQTMADADAATAASGPAEASTLGKQVNMMFLHVFYLQEYEHSAFYPQFYERLERMRQLLV